jgi:signal transduction histidine kinase
MEVLRSIFELNRPIILFGYGLTFFVMGFAIALQSRSSSRLELARGLAWLAAFGIFHSLYLWGELFSPVHEAYLTLNGVEILHDFHLLCLSISFICLFEFGVALLKPLGKGGWLSYVAYFLILGYCLFALIFLPRRLSDPHTWHNIAEALARYAIGFPGALLAAYGLREQTFRHIAPLNAPHIVRTLRWAGIALILHAVFGGLIPSPIPFFPGNLLNTDTFEATIGIPPLVPQSIIGLILAVTIIRGLEVFKVETDRRIEEMEQQQILTAERERIARELHDGSIQTVYTAGLLVDSARKLVQPESPAAGRLDKAVEVLNDAIHDLRHNLSELKSSPSGIELRTALQQIAADPQFRSLVQISLDLSLPPGESLSPLRTDHVLAITREALSNTIRHANARHARLSAGLSDGRFHLSILDDGDGFSQAIQPGYGLRNMQDRARLLGGSLQIQSEPGRGTLVSLDIPWVDER